jgi:hypothetical protein
MDATGSTGEQVTIRLGGSEALVLFDALAEWEKNGMLRELTAADPAARQIVSDSVASFEPLVDVALSVDYAERVERARAEVLGDGKS